MRHNWPASTSGARAGVELGVEPLRAWWEPATDQASGRSRGRVVGLGSWRGDLDERNDQLVHETAFRAGDAQCIGLGEHLDEHCLASPSELVSERRDAQHVVEVDDEFVVTIGEGNVAR